MSLAASMLPLAYRCGLAPKLAKEHPSTSGYAAAGLAYEALVEGDPRAPDLVAALEPGARAEVDALPRPSLPEGARHQVEFAIDGRGRHVAYDAPARIVRGRADLAWVDGEVQVVADMKGGWSWIEDGAETLQNVVAGFALSDLAGLGWMRLGIWRAQKGLWLWSQDIELTSEHAAELWRRVLAAVNRKPIAAPGPHCEGCYARGHCPERLLPALKRRGVAPELAPFTAGGPELTAARAAAGLRAIAALREVADRAEEQVRAAVLAGMRIEEDGKVYGPFEVAGRASADVKALEADGHTQYIRRGAPYLRWGWRRA